jgi:4-amino-4-deoxy-L-arabinose transferase-like glycosyltransferase
MTRKEFLIVSVLSCVLALPFLNKPFHIDDSFVLRITSHVIDHPLDPLGGMYDWQGYMNEVWRVTTNPPLISYFLSPFAAVSDFSEIALHIAMLPFYWLFGSAVFVLARRFTEEPWFPFLFFVFSAAYLVSANVMRDIPAAALATAGIAASIIGLDRSKWPLSLLGAVLLGLALLTKYPLALLVAPVGLYILLYRRWSNLAWLAIPVLFGLIWCAWTALLYGTAHPVYLLLERSSNSNILWQDKLFGALVVFGSMLFVAPVLLWIALKRKEYGWCALSCLTGLVLVWWGHSFYRSSFDLEFSLWLVSGSTLLLFALRGVHKSVPSDSVFLLTWLLVPLVFSVFFIPFQATRHQIPVLVPLLILTFRYVGKVASSGFLGGFVTLLVVQLTVAVLIHAADYEYAEAYRDFSETAVGRWSAGPQVWYVGHWGWKFYADRAGFTQLHRDGPQPSVGDILLWPKKVHIGRVFDGEDSIRDRLELLEAVTYEANVPIRTMSMDSKAGFYAVIRKRIPYRLDYESSLEFFQVFRVGNEDSDG